MLQQSSETPRAVYLVDGLRTPFLKARNQPGPFSAADLAVNAGNALLAAQPFTPDLIDELILGCGAPDASEMNIARIVALRLGCGEHVPAFTVQRNCASGMQAIDSGCKDIAFGRHDLVLAGGTEAMSRAPLLYDQGLVRWLGKFRASKGVNKILQLAKLRPGYFKPMIALLKGLNDPVVGLSMGQTAEIIAKRFAISREAMDEFALASHERLGTAIEHEYFNDITPIYDTNGHVYEVDDGLRRDSSIAKLGKLKPVFDKPFGKVTAGNSSQVTDGAAMLLLASVGAVERYNLPVLARIVDVEWAAIDPAEMGLGPAHAVSHLLRRRNLTFNDIDFMEINEAFAGQVLAVLAAWEDNDYCKTHLGLSKALGKFPLAQLNIDGGAVAIGHPVGASGARF